jgi:hypothetical protein
MLDWSTDDLSSSCVHPEEYKRLALAHGLPPTRKLLYERACLLTSLGMQPSATMRFLACRPVPQHSVSTSLFVKKLEYFHRELGISQADLCRLISHNTRLMDYSLEKTIWPRVQFFQEYFRTTDLSVIGKCVVRSPRMLWVRDLLNTEECLHILPASRWLPPLMAAGRG